MPPHDQPRLSHSRENRGVERQEVGGQEEGSPAGPYPWLGERGSSWVLSEGPCLLFSRLQAAGQLMPLQSRQHWEWQCHDLSEEGCFLACLLTHPFILEWSDLTFNEKQWKATWVKMTESGLIRGSPCFQQLLPSPHLRVLCWNEHSWLGEKKFNIVWQELSPQVLWQGKARCASWARHLFVLTSRSDKWKKAKNRWWHVSALPQRWQPQDSAGQL